MMWYMHPLKLKPISIFSMTVKDFEKQQPHAFQHFLGFLKRNKKNPNDCKKGGHSLEEAVDNFVQSLSHL